MIFHPGHKFLEVIVAGFYFFLPSSKGQLPASATAGHTTLNRRLETETLYLEVQFQLEIDVKAYGGFLK